MDKFKALLSRKVGGVPVMLIAAIVMGVFLFYAIFKVKAKPAEEPPTDEAATDGAGVDLAGDGTDTSQPTFTAISSVSAASTPFVQDTNDLWGKRALEWLISPAVAVSYNVASAAVTKYLAGESLTVEEETARDKAIKQFGLPPEGVAYAATAVPEVDAPVGGVDTTAPVAVSAPDVPESATGNYSGPPAKQGAPPCKHTVTGKSDDQASELARIYFGTSNSDLINKIKSRNTDKGDGPWAAGTVILMPENNPPTYYKATGAARNAQDIGKKNGIEPAVVRALNPGKDFPVAIGTSVRIK